MNILRGTVSSVMGLKLAGSEGSPFLSLRMVHAFFQARGVFPDLTELQKRIADQLNEVLNGKNEIPNWMNTGRTILCQKDPGKGNAVDNYRPITCLPLMWKLLTGMISNALYDFMESSG